jgi:hypothetical protein
MADGIERDGLDPHQQVHRPRRGNGQFQIKQGLRIIQFVMSRK